MNAGFAVDFVHRCRGNRAERFSMLCIQLLNFSRSSFVLQIPFVSFVEVWVSECVCSELVIDFGLYDVLSSIRHK